MISSTYIDTTDGQRIAKRLVNHWKHKFETAESDQQFIIYMPDATVTLNIQAEHLHVVLQSSSEQAEQLQGVIINHLNRMAQQEFKTQWTQD